MNIEDLAVGLATPNPLRLGTTALFLDLDGTLAPIADRPQDVHPDPRRSDLLARLSERLGGRLAIVSGRTLADVDRILEGRVIPVAAVHGLVRREADGRTAQAAPHPALSRAALALRRMAGAGEGMIVEDKGLSATLHYRMAPDQADRAQAAADRLAAETGLSLQKGDMVVELRTPGPDKGDSVMRFMAASPFAGAMPVFVGDDLTDEDGFAAAAELGGYGVLVGPSRDTKAAYRLAGVEEALAWLEAAR